jgi:hypothetical protein
VYKPDYFRAFPGLPGSRICRNIFLPSLLVLLCLSSQRWNTIEKKSQNLVSLDRVTTNKKGQ